VVPFHPFPLSSFYVFLYMKFLLLLSSPPYVPFAHILSLSTLISLRFLLSLFSPSSLYSILIALMFPHHRFPFSPLLSLFT
jgi:hypothetical protein